MRWPGFEDDWKKLTDNPDIEPNLICRICARPMFTHSRGKLVECFHQHVLNHSAKFYPNRPLTLVRCTNCAHLWDGKDHPPEHQYLCAIRFFEGEQAIEDNMEQTYPDWKQKRTPR